MRFQPYIISNHKNVLQGREEFMNSTTRNYNMAKHHHLPLQQSNLPSEIIIPGNRSKHQKNKQHSILNPPQQNSNTLKPLDAFSVIKVFVQVNIFGGKFISPD